MLDNGYTELQISAIKDSITSTLNSETMVIPSDSEIDIEVEETIVSEATASAQLRFDTKGFTLIELP